MHLQIPKLDTNPLNHYIELGAGFQCQKNEAQIIAFLGYMPLAFHDNLIGPIHRFMA
jgi:hypothetical protein